MRGAILAIFLSTTACTTRGPTAMTQRELKERGTKTFAAAFDEVYDAAYLALAQREGKVVTHNRIEGVFENEKVPITTPAGWDGEAFRSYAVSVFQDGSGVAVSAVPRLWGGERGERDVSDEPLWVLGGPDGEDSHWQRLFENVDSLLEAWRETPELQLERSRGEVSALGIKLVSPADWRSLELNGDRKSALAQSVVRGAPGCPDCPGGLNPSIVFDLQRRRPPPDAPHLERTALEHALGPKVAAPEAWDLADTQTGRRGIGQVVAGDPSKTVSVTWYLWDAGEAAWMFRAAGVCAPAAAPGSCDLAWDAMINGVVTDRR